jgi:hypothetical protein
METKSFKVSCILLVIVPCIVCISGLVLTFTPTFFMAGEFESFTGQKLADFAASNPKAHAFLLLEDSEMGIFLFADAFITPLITLLAFIKKEKWAWYLILIGVTLTACAAVGLNIPTLYMNVISMTAVLTVIAYVGLAIGTKSILRKSA